MNNSLIKFFVLGACTIATSVAGIAHAATYDLTDVKILGLYTLKTADKKSEIQKAELIYNNDNVLVLTVDRNDMEYELSGPNKDGVIYDGDDEPNCGGEEEVCLYDLKTVITLKTAKVGGKEIPRLTVAITQANAWDEEGKDNFTTTYVLDWNKTLEHSIPYFVNIENPELAKLEKSCNKALAKLEFEDGASYLGANAVCPSPQSVQLRDPFKTSLNAYMKYLTTGGRTKRVVTKLTPAELKTQVFDVARAMAAKYNPKKAESPSRADVLDQIDQIETFASQGDIIYTYRYIRDSVIVVVDSKTKRVSNFDIMVTDKYEH